MGSVGFRGSRKQNVHIWADIPCVQPVIILSLVHTHGMINHQNMKSLVVLTVLVGAATCWAPQPVMDTPEVAAAKAAHLAALAQAKQAAREKSKPVAQQAWSAEQNSIEQKPWKNQWAGKNQWNQAANAVGEDDGSWRDDKSWQNYDDGTWVDPDATEPPKPENSWRNVGEPSKWTGPIALPPGYDESGAPLPVEDTPEVAAAKAKHLQAYVREATKTSSSPSLTSPQRPTAAPVHPALPKRPFFRPASPPHQPARVVPKEPAPIFETNEFGDTPEVAAAKAAHFAVHAKRRS